MKKISLLWVVVLLLLLFVFLSRCEDTQVKDYGEQVIFVSQCDTSAVWRVKLHPLGSYADSDKGKIAIALENGKRFCVEYHASEDATKDWALLNEGDTVVYRGDKIVSIIWKKP